MTDEMMNASVPFELVTLHKLKLVVFALRLFRTSSKKKKSPREEEKEDTHRIPHLNTCNLTSRRGLIKFGLQRVNCQFALAGELVGEGNTVE